MANYTDSVGFYKNSAGFPAKTNNRISLVEVKLDFGKITAARAAAGMPALAATDTLDVMTVKKGALVLAGGMYGDGEGTATATLAFGDVASGTQFLAAQALDAEVSVASASTAQKFYAADTALRATFGAAAPGNAVVTLWVVAVDTFGDLGDVPGTV